MEIHSQEKKRAQNIFWNAANDYNIRPEFEVFDARGEVDLYWNFIIGSAQKYYDREILARFFKDILQDPNHQFYEELAWIGLENCTYHKVKQDRPVLESLRGRVSEMVLQKQYPESVYYLIDELKKAHFQRAMGLELQMREQVAAILEKLEFDASLTTEEIVAQLYLIIDEHFPLSIPSKKKRLFKLFSLISINLHLKDKDYFKRFRNPYTDVSLISFHSGASTETELKLDANTTRAIYSNKNGFWRNIRDLRESKQREMVQNRHGVSLLSETQTRSLEQALCIGNHKNCHLHITRGDFDPKVENEYKKNIFKQKENNQKHFKRNFASNNNSINRLTHIIKNTMLIQFEPSTYRAESGQLQAGRIWRSLYLNDNRTFLKTMRDDIGSLSVDILLDASGSQINRQEVLASSAYIITESLKRCQIPVRAFSFCTNANFTILNLLRDYEEENKNDRIFTYHSSGCNRDGLALRTVLHMINKTCYDHKILIVLSDGKPIDPYGIAASGSDIDNSFYSDRVGVNDAAHEVRKGRQNGISILCVFTGLNEDLPAAKKIYGNDLVTIKSPEKFADIVGVLLKNKLRNL